MEKKIYLYNTIALLSVLFLYVLTALSGSQLLGNLVSPIVAFMTAYLIWTTCKDRKHFRVNWILLALLGLVWGLADTGWLIISDGYGLDPESFPIIIYAYLMCNVLITLTTLHYFFRNIRKWHNIQLLLDVLVTSAVAFIVLWQNILRNFSITTLGLSSSIITMLYIVTDVLTVSIVFVMYSSSRVHKISNTMRFIISGITLYALADLFYIYLTLQDAYVPNTAIDILFMISIALFGIASINEAFNPTMITTPLPFSEPENMGKSNRWLLLLALPTILYLTGYFPVKTLGLLVIIVLVHQVLSGYVQGSIKNELLLRQERRMNEMLEGIIAERTEELVKANKVLDNLSKIDTLTGLFNRRHFLEEMDRLVENTENSFSVLYMDLDRFKVINDTHGHEMGDRVLTVVSERLRKWKPDTALLARLGGDEFVLIDKGQTDVERLGKQCSEIEQLVEQPIIIDSYIFHIGVSIGISRFPVDALNRDQLLKYADIAMYDAKKDYNSRNCNIYNSSQSDKIQRKHEIEILLRKAKFDEEFELYYQPQFNIHSNKMIGAEALLRWKNAEKGFISPMEFIPIAEETGIILNIGSWVMRKAIHQIQIWNESYNLDLTMGINISARQIDSVDFISNIEKLLKECKVPPEWIDFEITESSAMNTNTIMEEILTALSGIGLQISIDDFGTGYSSLSYIKRFDIDRLKIAKELVDNIAADKNELLIVKAIIMMAKGMGIKTIAEGVETEDQLSILRKLECDEIQGYIMGRPVPAGMFEENFLKSQN